MRDTVSSCCSGVESLVLAGTGRLSHRGVNKEVCLRASESPGTFTYAHDHPCTASQRSYGDAIDHDLDEISDVAGHVDPISADSSYLQRQFPDVSRNTARVLFTSLSDMDTTLSIEEKKPVNAEVAKALAMNLYHNSAEFLQAYRTLKFGTVQRIYRRYFLKWLQMHEQGGTRNAFTQTSVCIAEHATLATGLSSDEESERLRSQSPVPALVSRSLMSKYGRNASTRRCEELGMKSVAVSAAGLRGELGLSPSNAGAIFHPSMHTSAHINSASAIQRKTRHKALTNNEMGKSDFITPPRQYRQMEAVAAALAKAQRAVLDVHSNSFSLRSQQHEDEETLSTVATTSCVEDIFSSPLDPNSRNTDSMAHLERSVRVLCHLVGDLARQQGGNTKKSNDQYSGQEHLHGAIKAAPMYEGERCGHAAEAGARVGARDEDERRDARVVLVMDGAATFAARAAARWLKSRAWRLWRDKMCRALVGRERLYAAHELGKMRLALARNWASFRERKRWQAHCFHHWRARYLYARIKRTESEKYEQAVRLKRVEAESAQHVELIRALEDIQRGAEEELQNEQQQKQLEVLRFKEMMEQMMQEVGRRSEEYAQREKELLRCHEAREGLLVQEAADARANLKRLEEVVRSLVKGTDRLVGAIQVNVTECLREKAEVWSLRVLEVCRGLSEGRSTLEQRVRRREKQLRVLVQVQKQVPILECRCKEAERLLAHRGESMKEQVDRLKVCDDRLKRVLGAAAGTTLLWRCWSAWHRHVAQRGRARVAQTLQTVMQQFIHGESACRQHITHQEAGCREVLRCQSDLYQANLRWEQTHAELMAEKKCCVDLNEEMLRESLNVDHWRDAHNSLMKRYMHTQAKRLFTGEQAARTTILYEERSVRLTLYQQFLSHYTVVTCSQHRNELEKFKEYLYDRLRSVCNKAKKQSKCVAVSFARATFSRWLLFSERKKHQRALQRNQEMYERSLTLIIPYFENLAELVCEVQKRKLNAVEFSVLYAALVYITEESRREKERLESDICAWLSNCGALWSHFVADASDWCGAREAVFLQSAHVATSLAYKFFSSNIMTPFAEHVAHCLCEDRNAWMGHLSAVMTMTQASVASVVEKGWKEQQLGVKELLKYQGYLEQRITVGEFVGRAEGGRCLHGEAHIRTLREALERSELACDGLRSQLEKMRNLRQQNEREWCEREQALQAELNVERQRHKEEVETLIRRMKEQEHSSELLEEEGARARARHEHELVVLSEEIAELRLELDTASRQNNIRNALCAVASQYERVLVAMEHDVSNHCEEFARNAGAILDAEKLSQALLCCYEKDLNDIFQRGCLAVTEQQGVLAEMQHLRDMLCEANERTEAQRAMLCHSKDESEKQVLVLTAQLKEEERLRKAAENSVASARHDYEHEINILIVEGRRVQARLDGLQLSCSGAEERLKCAALEAKEREGYMRREMWRLETELQTKTLRHSIECDLLSRKTQEHREARDFAELMLGRFVCLWETVTDSFCELGKKKLGLYSKFCFREERKRMQKAINIELGPDAVDLRTCLRALVSTLERTNAHYEKENLHHESKMSALEKFVGPEGQQPGRVVVLKESGSFASNTPLQTDVKTGRSDSDDKGPSREDVALSIVRYSELLKEQHARNCARLQQLDSLVTQLDALMEWSRSMTSPALDATPVLANQ